VCDIISGKSFYKLNKDYFTKTEAHWFLNTKLPFDSLSSVIKQMFYAKCRARDMDIKLSRIVADVFTQKFSKESFIKQHPIVNGFLDLIARTTDYNLDSGVIGDIADFILIKIREHRANKNEFSLSGRTIASLISLMNEWHRDLQRQEPERPNVVDPLRFGKNSNKSVIEKWPGLGIGSFKYSQDVSIWTVKEIRTSTGLFNEGQKMRNCVASYNTKCAAGECSIFNISQLLEMNAMEVSVATLEVDCKTRTLVQARGRFNSKVTGKIVTIINKWAQENRIKVGLLL
jgi:hypothetical protein